MSAIVRRPGGALIPYTALDRRQSSPDLVPLDAIQALADVAEPFRDEYCAIADQIPGSDLFFGGPLNRTLINRNICGNTANPRPPVRGQCPGVAYDVFGTVFGFTSTGSPLRASFTSVGVTELWGEILDCRIGTFSTGRWRVEVLCRGVTSGQPLPPGNFGWRIIGTTAGPNNFSQVLGASVESWYAARSDGLPDNCAIVPSPPPIVIPPGQPIFTLPRIQSRFLPDVEIEVRLVESPSIYPTFELDIDGALIEAQFTLEGIEFNFPGADFDLEADLSLEIANQVNNNLQLQLDNQTTAIELSLQGQITQQNNFIEEQNNELEIELSATVENAIELALSNVQVSVDLNPVLVAIDNVVEVVQRECDCEPCDLQPILDRLSELDIKFSERLDTLEENVVEAIDNLKRFLECYLSALWVNTRVAIPGDTQQLGQWTSSQSDTVRIFNVPATAIAVGLSVDDYDQKFVRVYKFDDDPMEIEAGYGHCSLLSAGSILSFDLVSTRRVALVVPRGVSVGGFRVSLKPGIQVSAWAVLSELPDPPICE